MSAYWLGFITLLLSAFSCLQTFRASKLFVPPNFSCLQTALLTVPPLPSTTLECSNRAPFPIRVDLKKEHLLITEDVDPIFVRIGSLWVGQSHRRYVLCGLDHRKNDHAFWALDRKHYSTVPVMSSFSTRLSTLRHALLVVSNQRAIVRSKVVNRIFALWAFSIHVLLWARIAGITWLMNPEISVHKVVWSFTATCKSLTFSWYSYIHRLGVEFDQTSFAWVGRSSQNFARPIMSEGFSSLSLLLWEI